MTSIVDVRNIKKAYGNKGKVVPVLHGIDLNVNEGEFVGIMGPSGSGKTTLLNLIATIDEPTSGEIVMDGESIAEMSETELSEFRRKKLGFIFQDYHLLDTLTVKENIILPLAIAGMSVRQIESRALQVAEQFYIRDILDQYPYQISGGQKQRTAACRAVITKPRLVLADEPTGALDSRSATAWLECMQELNRQDGTTIVMVTHDAYVSSFCSRVLFLKDGLIFTELVKGDQHRKHFFKKIVDVLTVLGGNTGDII